jgi:glycosyltransferase involved in cell wall biosynthesis
MKVIFLVQENMPQETSKAIWQRLGCISHEYDSYLITGGTKPSNLPDTKTVKLEGVGTSNEGSISRRIISKIRYSFRCYYELRDIGIERGDIVYTFQTYDLLLGFVFKYICGLKWVVDILDLPEFQLEDIRAAIKKARIGKIAMIVLFLVLARLGIKHSNLVITAARNEGEGFARVLLEKYQVRMASIVAIPNGVDPALIVDVSTAVPERSKYGGRLRLIYIGGVGERRGTLFLLNVLCRIQQEIPSADLVLVGEVERGFAEKVRASMVLLGLAKDVFLRGEMNHNDVIAELDASDVGLYPFPSQGVHDYAIPVKVGEYLARGKPVVATALEGVRGSVDHGVNGFLLPYGDVAAWSECICSLWRDQERYREMAINAVKKAQKMEWSALNERVLAAMSRLSE